MTDCDHKNLILLPGEKRRIRCRRCHLTLMPDELNDGYCPECFETSEIRNDEFDEVIEKESAGTRYRCETCGRIIELK